MMNVLIISAPYDVHAAAVQWGLRKLGCTVTIWDWTNFPRLDWSAFALNPASAPSIGITIDGLAVQTPFDVIWNRRPSACNPMPSSHTDDFKIIRDQSEEYLWSVSEFFGGNDSLWVNSPAAARRAEMKPVQLVEAIAVGFRIPDTLIGNDVHKVRQFFEKHHGQIIHKSFSPGRWRNDDGSMTVLRTSAVTQEHLMHEQSVRGCPGIFQELIKKRHEIRVTVMGDVVLAAAIYSQEDGPTVDWRCEIRNALPLRAFQLPDEVSERCLALCKALGLVFGCIDLIVTPVGDYVFLEINEAGQFLWLEEADPSVRILAAFCRFVAHKAGAPHPTSSDALDLADWNATPEREDFTCLYRSEVARIRQMQAL